MNNISVDSPNSISGNTKNYDTSGLQPRHENSGSSENDLMSDKMKETVIYIIIIHS